MKKILKLKLTELHKEELKKREMNSLFGGDCNSVICIPLQPFEMKEKLTNSHFSKAQSKYPEQKETLKSLVNGLEDDDNPVLMMIHLK